MIGMLLSPVVGWLGLGGVGFVAAVTVGIAFRKLLVPAIVVAGLIAAAMFVFARGAYYAHAVDRKAEATAGANALREEQKAAAGAERSVAHPGIGHQWVRDPYARD